MSRNHDPFKAALPSLPRSRPARSSQLSPPKKKGTWEVGDTFSLPIEWRKGKKVETKKSLFCRRRILFFFFLFWDTKWKNRDSAPNGKTLRSIICPSISSHDKTFFSFCSGAIDSIELSEGTKPSALYPVYGTHTVASERITLPKLDCICALVIDLSQPVWIALYLSLLSLCNIIRTSPSERDELTAVCVHWMQFGGDKKRVFVFRGSSHSAVSSLGRKKIIICLYW